MNDVPNPWTPPRSTARGRRWWLSRASVAVAVIIALAVAQGFATRQRPGSVRGAFAGYTLTTSDLHSVTGSWAVPRLTGASNGMVATWIGAQAPGKPGSSPFVQVGVIMQRGGLGIDNYLAFWSDTARGFHPQPLAMIVSPGDRLDAGLQLRGGQWHISLNDTTTGMSQSALAPAASSVRYNDAEWSQEDPSSGSGGHHRLPYAATSTVRFSGLTADGHAPEAGGLSTQLMTLPGSELGPSPLVGDAFSVLPRHPRDS